MSEIRVGLLPNVIACDVVEWMLHLLTAWGLGMLWFVAPKATVLLCVCLLILP